MINLTINGKKYSFEADANWLRRDLGVGAALDTIGMADLKRAGVTHVLNCSREDDTQLAKRFGIQACWLPFEDDLEPKPSEIFAQGVAFAREVLTEPTNKLYVHCAAGVHRGPLMALAIMCSLGGWKLEDAMAHIKKCRPLVDWPVEYTDSVKWYLDGKAGSPPCPPRQPLDFSKLIFTDRGVDKDGILRLTVGMKEAANEASRVE